MVVTGPHLAQPIIKPSGVENEIIKAFNALKKVGSGSYTNKQTCTYNDAYSYGNNYSREKPVMEKAYKYSDVFTAVPHPHNNYYDNNVAVYPVDNEQVIPSSHFIPQKEPHNLTNYYDKNAFSFDNTMPSKFDFDLSTLLAAPLIKQEATPDYTIPQNPLDFMNFMPPTQEVNTPDNNSTGVWGEIPKETVFQNTVPQVDDPFMNEFQFDPEPRLYAVASTDSLLTDTSGQPSPLTATTINSPMDQSSPWNDSDFQELLDTPLDFNDMDFFLPPPPKRIHDSPEPVMMSPQYPSSPETIQEVQSPITDEDYVKPKPRRSSHPTNEKTKSRSTILFGKHEDDIIHKLLLPNLPTPGKPITREKLVSMPVEEFNQLLEVAELNDIEVAFMKEWRRRGKNKTAAQVARKRKREEVGDLETEVEAMRQQKAELQVKYNRLRSQIRSLKERSLAAEKRVYKQFSNSSGLSVSRDTHLIHVARGNKLMLVPKMISVN